MGKVKDRIGLIRKERLMNMYKAIRDKEANQGHQALSQAEFAARIIPVGIAASDMSKFLSGDKKLSDKMCRRIVESFPEYGYRVAWLMGDDDIPTMNDVRETEQYARYIQRRTNESRTHTTVNNIFKILKAKEAHDGDIRITEPLNIAQLYNRGEITQEDFNAYCEKGTISDDVKIKLSDNADYVFTVNGKDYEIPKKDFYRLSKAATSIVINLFLNHIDDIERGII